MADDRLLLSDSISKHYDERSGSVYVQKKLSIFGPIVGHYRVVVDGDLYDLNDHYSKPIKFGKFIVRSPVEAAINVIAFSTLVVLTIVALLNDPESVDYWTLPFKLLHLFFHSIVHIVPNWSKEDGMDHKKCLRIICGIVFGISRYVVILIYFWRIHWSFFVGLLVLFGLTVKLRFLGELIKTAVAYSVVCVVMCRGECSGLCSVCSLGALLQLGASGSFYFVGQCKGHVYKPWTRDTDRKWIAYHVVSDIGNALWIIGSAYDPSSPVPLAFNEYGSQGFPLCWWP